MDRWIEMDGWMDGWMDVVHVCSNIIILFLSYDSYDEAYRDFITVSQLDSTLPSAHTNAGLILMNQKHNPRLIIYDRLFEYQTYRFEQMFTFEHSLCSLEML